MGTFNPAWSQETEVRAAIEARFPGGRLQCLVLPEAVSGIHLGDLPGTLYFPADGPTSPIKHLWVLYAARDDLPPPELVADLERRGVVRKLVVTATLDRESSNTGAAGTNPQTGGPVWATSTRHEITQFPFAIYLPDPKDESFFYNLVRGGPPASYGTLRSFPSRLYPDAVVPPSDQHYATPTVTPYATSVANGVCDRARVTRVEDIQSGTSLDKTTPLVRAKVTFAGTPPDWALTPAFRRAVIWNPTMLSGLDRPSKAWVTFKEENGRLVYLDEAAAR